MLSVKERDLCTIFIVAICCICVCHASCPSFQVSHIVEGKSVCCKPVFDCGENHEVAYCSKDGGDDICVPCPSGYVNWYNTSSLDPVKRSCFELTGEHSISCPTDTHPTEEKEFCVNMKCKCRFENCYYGDPCRACRRRQIECGVNEEINPDTGDCEPCKDMMYSPVGCAACLYNETAWLISQGKNQSVSEEVTSGVSTPSSSKGVIEVTSLEGTSKSDAGSMETNDGADSNSGDIVVPVVIALVLLVLIGLLVACCLFTMRKVNNGDTTSCLAKIYISVCRRNKKYKTDEESIASPPSTKDEHIPQTTTSNIFDQQTPKLASSSGDAGQQSTKPAASVAPLMKSQNAEGGPNGEAHMDLLKSPEGGACGADATNETAYLSSDN